MSIRVTSGIGAGPTELAAFDSALRQAGVANYNLIKLSSVIPEGMNVEVVRAKNLEISGGWGDKLYVVLAEERVITPNAEAWAGIGWAQEPATGRGLFVEHHGGSEATVRKDITDSLASLFKGRKLEMGKIQMEVIGTVCKREPACALVAAIYESSEWHKLEKGSWKPFGFLKGKKKS